MIVPIGSKAALSSLALLLLAACAHNNVTHQGSAGSFASYSIYSLEPGQRYAVSDPLSIQPYSNPAGGFNAQMIFLADQLERNTDRKGPGATFSVANFSNLDTPSETSRLGRLIAESLIHELQVRRWQVVEAKNAAPLPAPKDPDQGGKGGATISGSYLVVDGTVIVNVRCSDAGTGAVLSSAQARLDKSWFTDALLPHQSTPQETMRILGEKSK